MLLVSLHEAEIHESRLFSLRRKEAMKKANITHVVSVLSLPLDVDLFEGYKHLVVDINDVEDENILQHFPATNAFIHEGLDAGGGVLVHWYVEPCSFLFFFSYARISLVSKKQLYLVSDNHIAAEIDCRSANML